MSEEEKEAIEVLEEAEERLIKPKMLKDVKYINEDFAKAINTILNLIEKQQKEIEEKTTIIMAGAEKVKRLECQIEELLNVLNKEEKINYIKPIDIKVHNYISKDKIREKIEKYEKDYKRQDKEELFNLTKITTGKLSALNELLEEE